MVGSGFHQSEQGTQTQLSAVFKLNYQKVTNISTSIISGVLESLDSGASYFDTISILAYARGDYNYTLMSEVKDSCIPLIPRQETIKLKAESSCSYLRNLFGSFDLDYHGGESALSSSMVSPRFMTFNGFQCSEDGRVHMHIEFSNGSMPEHDHVLMPGKSLVSEGSWDEENNRLCLLACRISNTNTISDCTIGLSLWFSSVISIRNRTVVMGRIWSNKEKSDPDYFSMISFRNGQRYILPEPLPGLRYEYTELDAVNKSSCAINRAPGLENKQYPDVSSVSDMSFDFTVRDGKVDSTWAYARPISFGQTFYSGFTRMVTVSHGRGKSVTLQTPELLLVETNRRLWNVSYKITYSTSQLSTEISAEGMYNAATGLLCMVGCSYSSSSTSVTEVKDEASSDCEVLISVQFPAVSPEADGDRINGTIRSGRERSDPLYFEPLEISSRKMYGAQARESIWRMDMEITLVLISLTLSIVFIALQLFHANRNPGVLSSVSITMLVVLTLGHMIPLVLNFEALFFTKQNKENVLFWSGGWLEANEIIVRLMTMLALSLHLRLLQRTWTCRSAKESNKDLWIAESKGLKFCLPLYFAGALITWFLNRKSYDDQYSAWEDLVTYSGFILDGFLLPQIILNVFLNTKDRALAPLFYVGTTVIRAMPHLYDAYRDRQYFPHFRSSYIYASPQGDFYSLAWDIIIPLGGILFAVLIYLQQRFGGSCFVPQKFRKLGEYERVPVISV